MRDDSAVSVCVYCRAPLTVRDEDGRIRLTEDRAIDAEAVSRIHELLHAGQREQAIALYREETGVDGEAAAKAVDGYASSITNRTVRGGTVNRIGWLAIGVGFLLLAAGVGLLVGGIGHWLLGGGVLAIGLLPILLFAAPALRTLRYLGASVGEATILRCAYIGKGAGDAYAYQLHLRIEGPDDSAFETEQTFPVSGSGREKIHEGRRFLVKYFEGQHDSVLFYRHVEQD